MVHQYGKIKLWTCILRNSPHLTDAYCMPLAFSGSILPSISVYRTQIYTKYSIRSSLLSVLQRPPLTFSIGMHLKIRTSISSARLSMFHARHTISSSNRYTVEFNFYFQPACVKELRIKADLATLKLLQQQFTWRRIDQQVVLAQMYVHI